MTELNERHCEACRAGAPQVSTEQIEQLLSGMPGWDLIEVENIRRLQKHYPVKNFTAAMDFANRVYEIAEAEGHHPAIVVEWGKVTVIWWSHKIKGLHMNDFIMAAKTDALLTTS